MHHLFLWKGLKRTYNNIIINIHTSPVNNSQPVKEALLSFTLMSWMACGMNRKKIVNSSITMLSKNNQRSKTKYERTPDPNIPVERNHNAYYTL